MFMIVSKNIEKTAGYGSIYLDFMFMRVFEMANNRLCTLLCNHQNNFHYEVHYYQRVPKLWQG